MLARPGGTPMTLPLMALLCLVMVATAFLSGLFGMAGGMIIAFVLLALLPVLDPPLISTTATNFGATMAQFAMVALIAIGLNVVVGQTGLLDLGYVGFYAVGAYVVALLTSPASPVWDSSDHGLFSGPWAWIACIPLAIVITGITGVILGTPTLRVRGDYLAIVTLGFGEIVRLLADNLKEVTNGPAGLEGILFPELGTSGDNPDGVFSTQNNSGTLNYGVWWYWLALLLVVIVLLFVGNLERSRVGRSWIAIREDEDAAERPRVEARARAGGSLGRHHVPAAPPGSFAPNPLEARNARTVSTFAAGSRPSVTTWTSERRRSAHAERARERRRPLRRKRSRSEVRRRNSTPW